MNNRRANIQIIADILRMGEAGKTEIMYSVNMSYNQLEKYLDFLLEGSFLRKAIGKRIVMYRTTSKGKRLLQQIDKLVQLLEWEEEY